MNIKLRRTSLLLVLSLFALPLLLAGSPLSAQEKTAGDHVDDTWLHTKVKAKLATNQGGSINIEVYKGEVQLAGFTSDPRLEESIPDHASRVSGVKKVYNQIIVVEGGRSAGERLDDGVLVTTVEAHLADHTPNLAGKVNTESNRGQVLLSGFMDSEEQRQTVLEIVRGVNGVKKVIDGMNIKPDA